MESRMNTLVRYIVPSVGGFCVSFLYVIIDGIFVGRGVGVDALGAINIAIPFIIITMAIATLVTFGGTCITAIYLGEEKIKEANDVFMTSITITFLLSILMLAAGMVFSKEIAIYSGASPGFAAMTKDYIYYCSAFSLPMLFSLCLVEFVRNDGYPVLAFWAMVLGAAMNIVLDWIFIFPLQMGVIGAAIASGLGQTGSFVVLALHFARKKGILQIRKFPVSVALIVEIVKRGIPQFISQIGTPIMILCYNLVLVGTLGDRSVSAFGVINYILSFAAGIFMGVSVGIQPLLGQSYGRKDSLNLNYYFRAGLLINAAASVLLYVILLAFGQEIVSVFNADPQLLKITNTALPAFSWSIIIMSINMTVTIYFFSIKKTFEATVIAVCRSIVITACMIFIVPLLFGAEAVWYAVGIAETLTLFIAAIFLKTSAVNTFDYTQAETIL